MVFRDLVHRHPTNPEMQFSLGNALGEQKKSQDAVDAYREAIRLKPEYHQAHNNLGLALWALERLPEAVAAYREAIHHKPDFPDAHYNLGVALQDQGRLPEAVAAYRKAIHYKPDYHQAHNNLGLALWALDKLPEAVAAFREAIRLKPDYHQAHYNLGLALRAQGRLPEAVAAFQRAIVLKPDFPDAHYNLGLALRAQGRLPEAVAAFQRATVLKPENPSAHNNLGLARRDQGRFPEALVSLQQGHNLVARRPGGPSDRTAADIREVKRLIELDRDLPAFLAGHRQPSGADERLELASLCRHPAKRLYAAAARFYTDAFRDRPALMDDLRAEHRYNAACCAALAGCSRGEDKPQTDAEGRARLRGQALDWLRADLVAWSKKVEGGQPPDRDMTTSRTLTHWEKNPELAGVRDQRELEMLPKHEGQKWRTLWADVEALLQRTGGGKERNQGRW
jgi:tetratricopeptide (TPR) repeat protein